MKTVIMAGGFGTRLRPLTTNIPKPVAPVVNKPMMEHILDLLKKHNLTEIITALYFHPEVISGYFGDGSEFGVRMSYIRTETELGTAGCVKAAEKYLNEDRGTFIILSGDVLTDFDLTKALEYHKKKKALATMVLTRVEEPLQYGVVITEKDGRITKFLEKPSWGEVFSDTINTGIYILEPEVLNYIPLETNFDFSKNLFPLLLEKKLALFGYIAKGYWKDVGSLPEYRTAHYDAMEGKVEVLIPGKKTNKVGKGIWLGDETKIHPTAILKNPVVIGKNCVVKANAEISHSSIGDNCVIEEGVKISGSVLWDDSYIGAGASLKDSIICRKVELGAKCSVEANAVVGDNCVIGREAVIKASVKLWPHKKVDDGAILSSSLIWGEKWSRSVFGDYGVVGLANIEITPEFVAKLGAAYGAGLPKGSTILASRDNHRISRMTNRAMMTGLLSSGVNVADLGVTPIPVARYVLNPLRCLGGLHIRKSPIDPELIDIKFFDENGMDLPKSKEKSIEGLFFREDFRRARYNEVGEITFPSHAVDHYKEGFLAAVNIGAIKKRKLKVVVDYAFGNSSTIFPSILGKLGCEIIALNSYLDEEKLTKSREEFDYSIGQLSNITSTLKADFGFMFDAGSEKIFVVDDKGRFLSGDQALCLLTYMALKLNPGGTVAVPVTASSAIDDLAAKLKGKILRTKTNHRSMMEVAHAGKAVLVGERKGGYIFPKFQPALDAMMSVVKMMEACSMLEEPASAMVDSIVMPVMIRSHVTSQWEVKGAVMRNLIEYSKDKNAELIDGIKIKDKEGWVIVIPDGERPLFHVNAEARTAEGAKKIIEKYSALIKEWQK
ncbi:MAG: mannose-1-phosphate guanyltransferase [Candidatus Firestonebacteria bacterium]